MFGLDFGGGFGIWFVLVVLINFLIWGGLIVLIVLGIRWLVRTTGNDRYSPSAGSDAAMDVLRERFARGEIDAAEFEERKRALGG
jgi:putative membrane protein